MKTCWLICLLFFSCLQSNSPSFSSQEYKQEQLALKILKSAIQKHKKHQIRAALSGYKKVITIQPEWSEPYYNQGLAYGELHNYQQALISFNKALQLEPNNDSAYFNRGIAYYELGNYPAALKDFDRTIDLVPGDAKSYLNRALVKQAMGQKQNALQDAQKAYKFFKQLKNKDGQNTTKYLIQTLNNDY